MTRCISSFFSRRCSLSATYEPRVERKERAPQFTLSSLNFDLPMTLSRSPTPPFTVSIKVVFAIAVDVYCQTRAVQETAGGCGRRGAPQAKRPSALFGQGASREHPQTTTLCSGPWLPASFLLFQPSITIGWQRVTIRTYNHRPMRHGSSLLLVDA